MPNSPFLSLDTFRQAFLAGLEDLLEQPGFGVFILGLANATFDPEIHAALKAPLQYRFEQLAGICRESLSGGREVPAAPDDLVVFLKLMAIGFDGVALTEFRRADEWELQFNHIRAFRPARMTGEKVTGIHRPFDPRGFHFNKPFLRKEVFWEGELHGLEVELLYNKFPFTQFHGLLVPERREREPQYLSHLYHLYIWNLTEELGGCLPGVGFGYNSYGAFASVNHLHFQMFVRQQSLPLEVEQWGHNGGGVPYPVDCLRFGSAPDAWSYLSELHREGISYNLIYRPGCLYCLPRRKQGSYEHAPWTTGYAWYEMAGGVTTTNRADYDNLDAAVIDAELSKLQL
ncbi:hypothetical protein DJ030_04070 [bacterium endosymbiont of Escarpia laminata]|nr:MAG: hypothetical protein DJ031_12355 [bacterium endosymbiont of Escarpia laminata]RLJ21625.1 MAG: hypothetical protein DJ030_04070 [bacterium endosymbiont of Escarpia laminata]